MMIRDLGDLWAPGSNQWCLGVPRGTAPGAVAGGQKRKQTFTSAKTRKRGVRIRNSKVNEPTIQKISMEEETRKIMLSIVSCNLFVLQISM